MSVDERLSVRVCLSRRTVDRGRLGRGELGGGPIFAPELQGVEGDGVREGRTLLSPSPGLTLYEIVSVPLLVGVWGPQGSMTESSELYLNLGDRSITWVETDRLFFVSSDVVI